MLPFVVHLGLLGYSGAYGFARCSFGFVSPYSLNCESRERSLINLNIYYYVYIAKTSCLKARSLGRKVALQARSSKASIRVL